MTMHEIALTLLLSMCDNFNEGYTKVCRFEANTCFEEQISHYDNSFVEISEKEYGIAFRSCLDKMYDNSIVGI